MTNEEAKEFGNKAEDLSRLIDIAIQEAINIGMPEQVAFVALGRR